MANDQIWLANSGSTVGVTITDGYTIVDIDGNPIGQEHESQVSGENVRILNAYDVIFNVNSLSVAQSNTIALQAIIDGLPDSGGAIGIPHDIALTNIVFPRRTISGISNQPINFELFGVRPGVQIYGVATGTVFTVSGGSSGVQYTATNIATQKIRDLGITARQHGISVTNAGPYFTADCVEVRCVSGTAWHFQHCNNMYLDRVGAVHGVGQNEGGQSISGVGFIFDNCTGVQTDHLWARTCATGVIANNCMNLFGVWDVEGNKAKQIAFNNVKHVDIGLYMEQLTGNRLSMTGCEDIYMIGDGLAGGHLENETDLVTKLLCPRLYEVQLSGVSSGNIGTPTASNISIPVTFVSGGSGQWTYTTTSGMYSSGNYVDVAPNISGYSTANKVMDMRWQASGSVGSGDIVGTLEWSYAGGSGVWQTVEIRESESFRDYAFRGLVPIGVSKISYFGEPDSIVDFKLTHIAEVSRLVNYCFPS